MKTPTKEDLAAYEAKVAMMEKKVYTGEVSQGSLAAYRAVLSRMYHRYFAAHRELIPAE